MTLRQGMCFTGAMIHMGDELTHSMTGATVVAMRDEDDPRWRLPGFVWAGWDDKSEYPQWVRASYLAPTGRTQDVMGRSFR